MNNEYKCPKNNLEHHRKFHNENVSRNTLIEIKKFIDRPNNEKELLIKEALHIQEKSPIINIQNRNFTNVLKLFAINNTVEKNKNKLKMSPYLSSKTKFNFVQRPYLIQY